MSTPDYYEVLQINRNAEPETIQRVYHIMAARLHPDNLRTGDPERFLQLRVAYETLSDPARRARYDAEQRTNQQQPLPVFELREFIDGVESENNRRLGMLSLLYNRRRVNPDSPGISLLDLERLMNLPREYLTFTVWYLKAKALLSFEQNSDLSITAAGIDHVEECSSHNAIVQNLVLDRPLLPAPTAQAPYRAARPPRTLCSTTKCGRHPPAATRRPRRWPPAAAAGC